MSAQSIYKTWSKEAKPEPGIMLDVLQYNGLALVNPYELILKQDMQSGK